MPGYTCRCCGEYHEELPRAYGSDAPAYWYGMSDEVRARRFQLSSDTAVLDNEHFFILGRIEIALEGSAVPFAWGVWVTMGREDFLAAIEHWDTPGREHLLQPSVGFLSTVLPGYPDTLNMLVRVHHRAVGLRPFVELGESDHQLSLEQQRGITQARLEEIAAAAHHSSARSDA